MNWETN